MEQALPAKSDRINKYIIKLLQQGFKSLDQHLRLNNYHSKRFHPRSNQICMHKGGILQC